MGKEPPIYLDNNATTRMDSRVLDRMLPYFTEFYGNPASTGHLFGREARAAVEKSRSSLAAHIGAESPRDIVFTSGATESDNLAIKGTAFALASHGKHIITAPSEHKAVLDSCRALESDGFDLTYLRVEPDGLIDPAVLNAAIKPETILVSIMAANNEIGVVQDTGALAAVCRQRGVLFHTDATQAVGKVPFNARELGVDLASFTAHKIYGPKGAGALYVRTSTAPALRALIDGGGHERGFRSGTLNVPGIVGLGAALEFCVEELEPEAARLIELRELLYSALTGALDGAHLNGHAQRRLPGHISMSFEGIVGEDVLFALPDVALSTTSACSSESSVPSHVLKAIGVSDSLAKGTLRIGIGRFNTRAEVERAATRIIEAVRLGRRTAPRGVK